MGTDLEFYKYLHDSKTRDGMEIKCMKRLMRRVVVSMEWMIADMDYRNRVDDRMMVEGTDTSMDSPELAEARLLLTDIKSYLERM